MRRSIDVSSVLSSDDLADYDIISDCGHRSLESSIADLGEKTIREPAPSNTARERFATPSLTPDNIQAYVRNALGDTGPSVKSDDRVVRIYVDGLFDPLNAGHALQFRQAKLSFPSVHLMLGVFSDSVCEHHGTEVTLPHVERCELVRHCRWVDEVIPEAPWTLDEVFLRARRIDYVAIDEGASVNPDFEKGRVKGYDLVKALRKAIPTRPTLGLSPPKPKIARDGAATESDTLRRIPPSLSEELARASIEEDKRTIFDQPLVDLNLFE